MRIVPSPGKQGDRIWNIRRLNTLGEPLPTLWGKVGMVVPPHDSRRGVLEHLISSAHVVQVFPKIVPRHPPSSSA